MSTANARQAMPDWVLNAYDLCTQFGFKPKFDHDYPTPDFRKRVQVRAEKHVAPAAEVNKYAASMQRGEQFPPAVITLDGYLDDGATRVAASLKNKYPKIPMLILDERYEGASQEVLQRLHALGAAFNIRNGKGIDKSEIRKVVERIAANPMYDATRIAALLGTTEGLVRSIMAETKARERAQKLRVDVTGLTANQLRIMGRSALALNDAPLAELLTLTDEAGLEGKEVTALIKAMKDAKSDEGALKIVASERAARREQIATRRATGGKAPPVASAKLRQHLGFVLKFMNGGASDAVERNPAFHAEHLRKIDDSILALQQIGALQREAAAATTAAE
jgi:hypothetical protein